MGGKLLGEWKLVRASAFWGSLARMASALKIKCPTLPCYHGRCMVLFQAAFPPFSGDDLSFVFLWGFPLVFLRPSGHILQFRHISHKGPMGRHVCWPNPTSNTLSSSHSSLEEITGEKRSLTQIKPPCVLEKISGNGKNKKRTSSLTYQRKDFRNG